MQQNIGWTEDAQKRRRAKTYTKQQNIGGIKHTKNNRRDKTYTEP